MGGRKDPNVKRSRRHGKYREEVMRRDNGVCHICGQGAADAIDHIVPVSWGGSDNPENLAPAHTSCNSSKGDATPADWTWKRPSMWLPGYGPNVDSSSRRPEWWPESWQEGDASGQYAGKVYDGKRWIVPPKSQAEYEKYATKRKRIDLITRVGIGVGVGSVVLLFIIGALSDNDSDTGDTASSVQTPDSELVEPDEPIAPEPVKQIPIKYQIKVGDNKPVRVEFLDSSGEQRVLDPYVVADYNEMTSRAIDLVLDEDFNEGSPTFISVTGVEPGTDLEIAVVEYGQLICIQSASPWPDEIQSVSCEHTVGVEDSDQGFSSHTEPFVESEETSDATDDADPVPSFANCTEAREAGVTPIREPSDLYSANSSLDRDGDGVACE